MENNLRLFTTLLYSSAAADLRRARTSCRTSRCCTAVTTAAQRGVSVELFVSAVGDQFMVYAQRSYYDALLDAGVRIFRYPAPSVPPNSTIDDDVAVVGSSNMDMRSFALFGEPHAPRPRGGQADAGIEDAYRAVSSELTRAGGAAVHAGPLRRQRHAPDGCAAVTSSVSSPGGRASSSMRRITSPATRRSVSANAPVGCAAIT